MRPNACPRLDAKRSTVTSLSAAALSLILVAPAPAGSGDAVTIDNHADVAEMIRIADAIDAAVDMKDWAGVRALFAETIEVDVSALVGGAPAMIPADALIDGWAANLTAEKTSFRLRGNHRVVFNVSASATMQSRGYAWNRLEAGVDPANGGEALWEVWGSYTHGFARGTDG